MLGGWGAVALLRILVVDDQAIVRDFMEEILGEAGHEVRSAESGERALEILRDEALPLMFLDLALPGMNGLDLCTEIRKDHPLAVLHAMTRFPSAFELAECRAAGFDDYFIKPVAAQEILEAAQDAFQRIDRWNVECERG